MSPSTVNVNQRDELASARLSLILQGGYKATELTASAKHNNVFAFAHCDDILPVIIVVGRREGVS